VFRPQEFCEKTQGGPYSRVQDGGFGHCFRKIFMEFQGNRVGFLASTDLSGELMTLWDMSKITSNN